MILLLRGLLALHLAVWPPVRSEDTAAETRPCHWFAPQKQEALTVWYLGSSGAAVRIGGRLLIFDYQEEYGTSSADPDAHGLDAGVVDPAELRDLDVYVFTTHEHGDHYDPIILEWEDEIPRITYFFGWQAGEDPEHHYLTGPRGQVEVEGVEVYTINSHHAGVPEVAYLVRIDGRTIYHNGDYRSDYEEDFRYLATLTERIDIIFVNADPDVESQYFHQALSLIEQFRPSAFFPMHWGGEEENHQRFVDLLRDRGADVNALVPRRKGDRWVITCGEGAQDVCPTVLNRRMKRSRCRVG